MTGTAEDEELGEPIGGWSPPPPLEVWSTPAGIPCMLRAGFATICGLVQVPPLVLKHWPTEGDMKEALCAYLGVDRGAGPDDDGWMAIDSLHAGQVWDEDFLREHLRPEGFQLAMSIMKPVRDAEFAQHWDIPRLRAETNRLATRVAELVAKTERASQ